MYGTDQYTVLSEVHQTSALSTSSTEHIYLPTASGPMPVIAIMDGQRFAVHSDHLNTPRRLTDASNRPRWQWAYSAFGDVPAQSLPSAGVPTVSYNLRYPGQVDDFNGLFYNFNRFYDPRVGRYTQSDPIGLEGGWNRFGYVEANPLLNIDPKGLTIQPKPIGPAGENNMSPRPDKPDQVCFSNDCAKERQSCIAICTRARFDQDMPNVFGGSFQRCMRGCMPARCGGS
jgi:RHS repeat-associated protein